MYGKLFQQMYDGTLATRGPWQAMVTFQQLIILADKGGIVDMTRDAIARRTTIPIDIVNIGITALEQPDSESRTPNEEGRRIIRLSPDRDWGWRIVNHEHYRKIRSQEERREYMRNYQAKRRQAVNTNVNNVSKVNQLQYAGSSNQKGFGVGLNTLHVNHAARLADDLASAMQADSAPPTHPEVEERNRAIAKLMFEGKNDEARALQASPLPKP